MPGIGRPNTPSSFKGIGKYNGPDRSAPSQSNNLDKRSLGDQLNDIAGAKKDKQFVDRAKHNKLDKDAFLKLLSSQLQNQDPFKPVDQKKFAADMAQFAQLEQLTNMNSKLDKSTSGADNETKFMGASFIGKAIHTKGTSVAYDGESTHVNLPFYLSKPAKKIMVRVFDKSNNMIAQIEKDSMGRGSNSVTWDGSEFGNTVAGKGDYYFDVQAWDDEFQSFKGETKAEGVVTGVNFEDGQTILTVDGKKKVQLKDVESFFLPTRNKQNSVGAKNPQLENSLKKNANAAYNKVNESNL